jgi:hypothetical protein
VVTIARVETVTMTPAEYRAAVEALAALFASSWADAA